MKNNFQETNKPQNPPKNVEKQQPQQQPNPEAKGDKELEKLAEEVAHWKDLAMRATAEMENVKKRTQIDIAKANRYATGGFAKDLLPVADSLEQAISFTQNEIAQEKAKGETINPVLENLLKGVEMTAGNLVNALKKQQIEKMESLGKVFDPNLHKVIQEVEDATKPAGTIIQELQTGYTIGGDRVLREAMVIVTK
ncbi:MAG: nucleotide exchange factor GrpE [Alphaproteobacteria bacterium]|nr:nucleotide exchange factor GrpE [Alphaproteobacteria bacterium]